MRSDVVFDSLCLDRCLRFGWHLDVVMLFLLRDTSLMFRSNSVVFGLPGSCICWWMIWCHLILWSITFDAILGHISVLDEICRFLRSCMLIPTCRVCAETMMFPLFYDDPFSRALVEPLIQVRISRHRVVFILFILRDVPRMFGFDLDHGDHMFDDRWFHVTRFPTYRTFDATLGHISISEEV